MLFIHTLMFLDVPTLYQLDMFLCSFNTSFLSAVVATVREVRPCACALPLVIIALSSDFTYLATYFAKIEVAIIPLLLFCVIRAAPRYRGLSLRCADSIFGITSCGFPHRILARSSYALQIIRFKCIFSAVLIFLRYMNAIHVIHEDMFVSL